MFLSNYVCLKPVNSLQSYPTAHLDGKDAVARFYSILVGTPTSDIDLGGRVILNQPGCRAEIVSRAITNGGRIMARGHLVGNSPGIKAHLECKGLILAGGSLLAVPQLDGYVDGVEMSHEAAVGKIAQQEINYLMSRGLSEEEATRHHRAGVPQRGHTGPARSAQGGDRQGPGRHGRARHVKGPWRSRKLKTCLGKKIKQD